MRVWVLTNGEYDDEKVWGVFTNPECVLKKYSEYEWRNWGDGSYTTKERYEDRFTMEPYTVEDTL